MIVCVLFYVTLEVVVLGLAFAAAARAKSVPVLLLLAAIVYGGAAVGLAALPSRVLLPGAEALTAHWAIYPVVSVALAGAGTWIGFRRSAGEWEGTPEHRAAQRLMMACLAVMLVHVAALVLMGAAAVLMARDSF